MEKKPLTTKDSSIAFVSSFLLCQFGVVFASIVMMLILKITKVDIESFEMFSKSCVGYLISALCLYFIMLCIFIFYKRKTNIKINKPIKLKKLLLYVLIAATSFFALYPIIMCIDSLLIKCGVKLSSLTYSLTTKNYFISLISLVVAPAICEELLFRGVIFKGLNKHGKTFTITISAIMFSLFHMSISQTIYPLLMGLLFGVIMCY